MLEMAKNGNKIYPNGNTGVLLLVRSYKCLIYTSLDTVLFFVVVALRHDRDDDVSSDVIVVVR